MTRHPSTTTTSISSTTTTTTNTDSVLGNTTSSQEGDSGEEQNSSSLSSDACTFFEKLSSNSHTNNSNTDTNTTNTNTNSTLTTTTSLENNMHPKLQHHHHQHQHHNNREAIQRPSQRKNSSSPEDIILPLSFINSSGSTSSIPDYWKPFISLQGFLLVGLVYFAYFLNILYCFHHDGLYNGLFMSVVNISTMAINFYWFYYTTTVNPNLKVLLFNFLMFTLRFSLVDNKMLVLPSVFSTIATTSKGSMNNPFKAFFPIAYTCSHYLLWGVVKFNMCGMEMESFLEFLFQYGTVIVAALLFGIYNLYFMVQLSSECKALKDTTRKLQTALDVKSDFLSHITHEFRVPCLSSLGSISLLKETEMMTPEQLDHVGTIESANNILLTLIEDILLFVKTEHEVNHPPKENNYAHFSLFNSINSIYSLTKGYAANFKVDIKFYIDKNVQNLKVFFSHSKLQQCLSNLLTNAIKASKPNDTVTLKCEIVGEGPNEGEKIFQFQIIDHGVGIPSETQQELFVPFTQLHQINEDLVPSSGLGLSTCLNIVKSSNGTIDVFSENGTTIFTVVIPMKSVNLENDKLADNNMVDDHDKLNCSLKRQLQVHTDYLYRMEQDKKTLISTNHAPPPSPSQQQQQPFTTSLPKIILAEDNFVNRKVLIKLFESLGVSVDSVHDGKELVEAYNPDQYGLIVTDMHMPVMNGLEAAKIIKEKHPKSKIVMITADALLNISAYLEVVDLVISKPCNRNDLEKVVNDFLRHNKSSEE